MFKTQSQPIAYPPKLPVDDGLVLYLPFQEGSGRHVSDLSGRDSHCTLVGAFWNAAKGKKGFAPTFDGINDKGTFNKIVLPSGDFTMMGWLYCEGDQTGNTDASASPFGNVDFPSSLRGCLIKVTSGYLRIYYGNGSGYDFLHLMSGIQSTNSKKWFHICARYIAATTSMYGYVNASQISTKSSQAYSQPSSNFEIAHSSYQTTLSYWYGQLKNIRVYNRALPVDELRRIYEAGL